MRLVSILLLAALLCAAPQEYRLLRQTMVDQQLETRGINDPEVLEALRSVPRHEFVPEEYKGAAYGDHPLPIGYGATISQPYIVGLMTELLDLDRADKVLEVGTGSGYQAAILSKLAGKVYSIEIVPELAEQSSKRLKELGFSNVTVRQGDGYQGWPEQAPFDKIILTAAPPRLPEALLNQLRPGGVLVAPVGSHSEDQRLVLVKKKANGQIEEKTVLPVRFVPMVPERR